MGNTLSSMSEEELSEYEELTYLTRKEILHAWDVWKELISAPKDFADKTKRYPAEETVLRLPELQHNPFKDQIARHFGDSEDVPPEASSRAPPTSMMSFENFLDLLHVMSPRAPLQLKAHYAFRIFDFNDDAVLDESDLAEALQRLSGGLLTNESRQRLIDKLLEEGDLEGDASISEEEFTHLLSKCPDFTLSFRFTL